jgi:hypothetical protein
MAANLASLFSLAEWLHEVLVPDIELIIAYLFFRKNERKTLLLKEKLAHIQQRETTAQDTLNEVLKVVSPINIKL